MVRHEALEKLEVSSGGFLGFAEHDVTFADCDFRKNFSGGGVADREVGRRSQNSISLLRKNLSSGDTESQGNSAEGNGQNRVDARSNWG
jgi:hypothetical protein